MVALSLGGNETRRWAHDGDRGSTFLELTIRGHRGKGVNLNELCCRHSHCSVRHLFRRITLRQSVESRELTREIGCQCAPVALRLESLGRRGMHLLVLNG